MKRGWLFAGGILTGALLTLGAEVGLVLIAGRAQAESREKRMGEKRIGGQRTNGHGMAETVSHCGRNAMRADEEGNSTSQAASSGGGANLGSEEAGKDTQEQP